MAGAAGPGALAPDNAPPETERLTLYFANDDGQLRPETRELSSAGTTADRARRVVQALIEGPRGPAAPALPPGCALRALYLTPDGTAYVDLDSGFRRGLSGGSRDALVAVWAITDTLAVNFPDVRAVKILVEGEEVLDLGGHLDLSRPLAPDMSLVEEASPGSGEERRP